MIRLLCAVTAACGLVLAGPALSRADDKPAAEKPNARYERRIDHDPNGIGKFYLGREIAHVMGFGPGGQGAIWLERETREKEEKVSLLVKSLGLKPGMVVADVGAGSGVISILMAEHLGADGKVLAVDIQQEMLDRLKANCEKLNIKNIEPVKSTDKASNLKPGTVDLIVMVDVYHEFEFPHEMLSDLSKSLKVGGRIAFVEYRKEDPSVPIKEVHKMSEAQVRKEAEQPEFNLKWVETIAVLPRQHVVVFKRQK